ncbi:MAG: hypothetical protein B5M53_08995 [Candidatus Cloacimonas sp. 4484_209]|nr:MAG: hypothetical protein B5M53_08995 [Candidatus Cloacimonas sp. 4484_209]
MDLDHEIIVHEWKHWIESKTMSIKRELESILDEIGGEDFNLLAKSVGTRVAMYLIPLTKSKVRKVILCGIPTKGLVEKTKTLYLNGIKHLDSKDILCIQNSKDPLASYKDVARFINSINPRIRVVEMPGGGHDYPYSKEFLEFFKD